MTNSKKNRKVGINMIKPVVKDILFLGQKSEIATKENISVIDDLVDTLRANLEHCVGMAANMIGIKKRILVFSVGNIIVPMVNPVILKKENSYETEESCLSLTGFRKTMRYETIEVEYFDRKFKKHKEIFTGFTAQIIQHEMDHFEGIII
ncbi:peptide deformylase [Clostridium baratii]|uniref:Peptide deformylase n=2 Tax=Clostridium baratii TaxID=1561 RepID=A0A174TUL3_9CLOT|nr:peptide deformylase [Clostridium baratii]